MTSHLDMGTKLHFYVVVCSEYNACEPHNMPSDSTTANMLQILLWLLHPMGTAHISCHVNSYAVTDPVEVAALPLAAGITFILYVWVLGIPNPVTFHLGPSAAICTFPSELPTKTLKCTSFQLLLWPQTEYVFVPQYLLKLKVHSHIHNSLQVFPIPS